MSQTTRILMTYVTGIGNTILCIPTLRALRQHFPQAQIDVVVRHSASQAILDRVACSRQLVFNPARQPTWGAKLRFLQTLRQARYEVNLTAFPSNRAEFNLLSFMIGAKRRIAPRYPVGHLRTFGFLQTEQIATNAAWHDIDQNLALLTPLGVNIEHVSKAIGWPVTPEEHAFADAALQALGCAPGDTLVGFHPGCNPGQGNVLKRWPAENFAQLGDRLIAEIGAKIVIFGDPDETALKDQIRRAMRHAPLIPENASLLKIAALIRRCRLFVTNDSGVMHVAAAMGVPTISLFGPSDPQRNAPYGAGHTVLTAHLPCQPCNQYPLAQAGGSYVRCIYAAARQGLCMQQISVEQVAAVAGRLHT